MRFEQMFEGPDAFPSQAKTRGRSPAWNQVIIE
jgi:hypothetical protein